MIWIVVGCRHGGAELAMREKLSFSEEQTSDALAELKRRWPELEAVILSTCNRVEIYAAMEIFHSEEWSGSFPKSAAMGAEALVDFLAEWHHLERSDVSAACFRKMGHDAMEHLFRVAASLDSMVVGEAQIAGQVRAAYQLAVDCDSVGPLLHAAFQRAGSTAKKVTTETRLHQYRTSIPSVAVGGFAKQIFEHLDRKNTLVIGAGDMAEETLLYLREEGVKNISVANRHVERAAALAEKFHGTVCPWEELDAAIVRADLIVSATGATQPVVTRERYKKLEGKRNYRPLFVLDLAVPRDFEAEIGSLPNVYLYTVDDLRTVCEENAAARAADLPKAEAVVSRELATFVTDIRHHKSGRVIQALRDRWNREKNVELERLFHKMTSLTDHDRGEISYAFDRLLNKLLHLPMESLRDEAGENPAGQRGLLDAMRKLFGL
ncbi:MAG: glutamyl-tRNA reductase [Planctomycetia bacterium]|nr:glutamyl-tRNA reductase [Planctomycetia bacterium]